MYLILTGNFSSWDILTHLLTQQCQYSLESSPAQVKTIDYKALLVSQ